MGRKIKLPQQYAIVRLSDKDRKFYQGMVDTHPKDKTLGTIKSLLQESNFIFLGEIPNMPGHVVVAGMKSGKVFAGWHPEMFEQLSDEET